MTDEEFCIDILPKVSRTFALSIEALPEPLRATIRVSYLLCRIVDTIEDDPDLERAERERLFDLFRAAVSDDGLDASSLEKAFVGHGTSHDHDLCRGTGAALRIFRGLAPELREAARPHILEMAAGMAEYATRWRGTEELTVLEDVEDLERYCYFVAGTVGNLLTDIFITTDSDLSESTRKGLSERSVSFGLGLQLTNIVKDVTADRPRGWCFLPRSLCVRHGIEPEELLDSERRENAMAVIRDVVEIARGHLDNALEYTLLVPSRARDVRLFVLVPLVLALASLSLVHQSPEVLISGKPVKISRATVANALTRAHRVVEDDEGVRTLCQQAADLDL